MINKILEKISPRWFFLAAVLVLYLFLLFVNFSLTKEAIIGSVQLFKQIIPVFLLVFVFMFLSKIFFKPDKISRLVGEKAGLKGWLISIIAGVLSSGPIYMWYPLLADFKEKGMKDSFIAVFLYNRAVKIPLIPMMIFYFGLPFVLTLTFYMILFSIINGVLVEKFIDFKFKN